MSKKKAAGKLKQQKRPNPKYLGTKTADGESVKTGSILVRQRGTKFSSGKGTKLGRDHTIFSLKKGVVKFTKRNGKKTISVV